MSSSCVWPSMIRLGHLCSKSVAQNPGEELLISGKLLLLLVLMSAEPSLECMHTLAVIQSVHLQAKGK